MNILESAILESSFRVRVGSKTIGSFSEVLNPYKFDIGTDGDIRWSPVAFVEKVSKSYLRKWAERASLGGLRAWKTVVVEQLADDHETVLIRYTYSGARPVSYDEGKFDAASMNFRTQTTVLAFDTATREVL